VKLPTDLSGQELVKALLRWDLSLTAKGEATSSLGAATPRPRRRAGSQASPSWTQEQRFRRLETRTAAIPTPTSVNDAGSGVADTPVTANAFTPPATGDDT
jgi:hypothetical protein